MAADRPRTTRERLFSILRTSAALVLLVGGVLALLGFLATTGEETAWDVVGVILLVAALLPTLLGAVGLLSLGRRGDDRAGAPPRR